MLTLLLYLGCLIGVLLISGGLTVYYTLEQFHPLSCFLLSVGIVLFIVTSGLLLKLRKLDASGRRQLRIGLSIALIATLVSLVFADLLLGVFYPAITERRAAKFSPGIFRASDVLPFELKKSYTQETFSGEADRVVQFTTNSHGYRSPEFSMEKPENVIRVVLLGDSFAANLAMDDKFVHTALLQDSLDHEPVCPNQRVEVINAGYANGYSPDAYAAYLLNYGFKINPDLIIMQYFVRNDFLDLLETTVLAEKNGLPVKVQSKYRYIDDAGRHRRLSAWTYRIPFLKNSHIFWHVHDALGLEVDQVVAWVLPKLSSSYSGDNFAPNSFGIKRYHPYLPQSQRPEVLQDAFLRSIDYVKQIAAEVERRGIRFVLFLVPSGLQVYQETFPKKFEESWEDPYPQQEMREPLSKAGIEVWNPLLEFRNKAEEGLKMYIGAKNDGHWTEDGNRAAAEFLEHQIRETDLCLQ